MAKPDKYTVKYRGKAACRINPLLLKKQKAEDNLELIKYLHKQRLLLEDLMKYHTGPEGYTGVLEVINKDWREVQFKLQDAWGFDRDARMHRFWEVPGCKCPKMDNNDSYPSGRYIVSGNCLIHKSGE